MCKNPSSNCPHVIFQNLHTSLRTLTEGWEIGLECSPRVPSKMRLQKVTIPLKNSQKSLLSLSFSAKNSSVGLLFKNVSLKRTYLLYALPFFEQGQVQVIALIILPLQDAMHNSSILSLAMVATQGSMLIYLTKFLRSTSLNMY